MRRRDWVLVLGAGLFASLLPACSSRPLVQQPPGRVWPEAKLGAPEELPAPVAVARSPYHQLPLLPARGEDEQAPPKDSAVEPVGFPVAEGPSSGLLPHAVESPMAQSQTEVREPDPASQIVEEQPFIQAWRCFQEKRPDDAVQRLAGYDKPNQEILLAVMPLAVRLTEGSLTQASPQEMALMVEQLESLIGPLRKRAALTIEKICFCRRIHGYGDYVPLPDDHCFRPSDLVHVYVQLRNFSCEPQDGAHVTRLASRVDIKNFAGTYKRRYDLPARSDYSKEQRHDYFSYHRFTIPDDIPPGWYTLTIRIVDQPDTPRQRTAERSLDFRVTTRNRMEESRN